METTRKVFVTGGTGFIGTRLVEALIDRGETIRVLSRRADAKLPNGFDRQDGGPWPAIGGASSMSDRWAERVELVRGDINDRDSLVRGMEGCSRVFHLAAYAKHWARDPQTYFNVNVRGMRNVLDAAGELGVERVVCTSSIVTLGPTPPGVVGDEDMPRITDRYYTEYEESKTVAERETLRRAQEGLPVVIVNPTRVFGPGHLGEGNALSRLIDEYDRGKMPFLLGRGMNVGNYVLVDDVAQGHILAMEKGRPGQRYILGGENVSLRDLLRIVDRVSGKQHLHLPTFRIVPLLFAEFQKKRAEWLDVYPRITPGWVKTFLVDWAHSSEKARRELGYRPTPLVEAVRITYEWLQRIRKRA